MAVEVNTSIICACVPPLKSTIVRLFPRLFTFLDSLSSVQHTTPANQGFSRTVFTTTITASGKHTKDQDSDEEIMLQVMGRNEIERKNEVHVNYSRNDDVRDDLSKDDSRIESLH
jgi:5-deoxy-D-glucuronate isomerase